MVWNALVNRPNNIREKQIIRQNEKVPTYMKGNGKYYYRAYLVLFGISFIGSNYTLIQYVRGKAAKNE